MLKNFAKQPDYIVKKNFFKKIICKRTHYAHLRDFLNSIDTYLQRSNDIFFKNQPNDTTTVGVISVANIQLVVKRYNFRNFWHGLKLRFRGSRAMRSWIFSHQLKDYNIPTANPVAVVEKRLGPLRGRAYYITEYIPGVRGCDYFSDQSAYQSNWCDTILAIEKLTLQLRENGFSHADYHFGNLIIKDKQVFLVDLDNMRQHKKNSAAFLRRHQKDIRNFRRYLARNQLASQAFKTFQRYHIF